MPKYNVVLDISEIGMLTAEGSDQEAYETYGVNNQADLVRELLVKALQEADSEALAHLSAYLQDVVSVVSQQTT